MATNNEESKICTRGYQQEMLDISLHRNVIIALDTGAGKTHIAVLRLRFEVAQEERKVGHYLLHLHIDFFVPPRFPGS